MARSNIEKSMKQVLSETEDDFSEDSSVEIEVDSDPEDYADLLVEEMLPEQYEHSENLASIMDKADLDTLAKELATTHEADKTSRADWDSIVAKAIDLLGFKIEEMDEPFPGACGATHPLLAQAVVRFQARAYKELFPSQGPVRTKIIGRETPEKAKQALRVRNYMNWQTTEDMPEFGPELDKLLFAVGLMGSAFKKTYYDERLARPVSRLVKAQDFYVDYYATDLTTANRYTHVMVKDANEVRAKMVSGSYLDIEALTASQVETSQTDDAIDEIEGRTMSFEDNERFTICETHIDLDLDEDPYGLALPYIVTWDYDSETILSIRRNWAEEDPARRKILHFEHFKLIPGLGFYGYGYIHLIGGLANTATSNMRQLNDAGTFANLSGGFKASGLRVLAPDDPISPGEWREVNAPAGDVSKSLYPFPYKEPSPTLLRLMEYLVVEAKDLVDQSDKIIQDATNYGPVGTTMALLEHSAKLTSAVHKRLYESFSKVIKRLARINYETLPEQFTFADPTGATTIFREDFNPANINVIPVADPNSPSEAHRLSKLNTIKSLAMARPDRFDIDSIDMDMLVELGVENPERYFRQNSKPLTADPLSEISAAIMGQPIMASIEQNHDAHIMVKSSVMKNPAYAENAQMRGILFANMQQHLAMKFTLEMLDLIGDDQLTQAVLSGQPLPPDIQNQIAVMAAQHIDALTEIDVAKSKALMGVSTDPVITMQEEEQRQQAAQADREYYIKAMELKLKEDKIRLDEAKLMINDVNTDLDREARIHIEKMKQRGKALR
jgi:hypothetical protein